MIDRGADLGSYRRYWLMEDRAKQHSAEIRMIGICANYLFNITFVSAFFHFS